MEENLNQVKVDNQTVIKSHVSSNSPSIFLLGAGGVILLGLGLLGGYFLWGNKSSNLTQTLAPSPTLAVQENVDQVIDETTKWSKAQGKNCQVTFLLPPKQEPYLHTVKPFEQRKGGNDGTGRFWDFPRGTVYPNLISMVIPTTTGYVQDVTMYASPDDASGGIASAVAVSCFQNYDINSNEQLLGRLKEGITEHNKLDYSEGILATSYKIEQSNTVMMWGKDVLKLDMSEYFKNPGGDPITKKTTYYMFINTGKVYEVVKIGDNSDNFVGLTADKILNNLSFR